MTSILHNLTIIGESVNHFPESVFERHPDIPWRNIIGMRHLVVHEYVIADYDIVIDAVDHHLAPLEDVLIKEQQAYLFLEPRRQVGGLVS